VIFSTFHIYFIAVHKTFITIIDFFTFEISDLYAFRLDFISNMP
jgi:hypothetical protein